jgi:hypothetical protein
VNLNILITYIPFLVIFLLLIKESLKLGVVRDEFTFGGSLLGLLLSFMFPIYSLGVTRFGSFMNSLIGLAAGYIILWSLLELGKVLCGNKKLPIDVPVDFCIYKHHQTNDIVLDLGGEEAPIDDFIYREKDRVLIEGIITVNLNDGTKKSGTKLEVTNKYLCMDQTKILFNEISLITGEAKNVLLPREVIGFGVVKLGALVGSFIGVPGIIYCIVGTFFLQIFTGLFVLIISAGKSTVSTNQVAPYMFLSAVLWLLHRPFGFY